MIPLPIFTLIDAILQLYTFIIFVAVIFSWLIGFNVINRHNRFVDAVWRTLVGLTEPALSPIRRLLPSLGGIDISPIILLLGIFFLREMNWWLAARIALK